jgi:hypothetical protein
MKVLAWALIPATYEEASYWMTRLMGHYPRMDTDAKAVVIGDICAAVVRDNASLCAVAYVYEQTWRSCTKENPWPPQAGQIVNEMLERMGVWAKYYKQLSTEEVRALPAARPAERPAITSPYGADKWDDMTDDARAMLLHDLEQYSEGVRNILRDGYGVPDGEAATPDFKKL